MLHFKAKSDKAIIQKYADENQYVISSIETPMWGSPFYFIDEDTDTIYKVIFIDSHEHEKIVWFKIGFLTEIKIHNSAQ